jgi:hypothetical protein
LEPDYDPENAAITPHSLSRKVFHICRLDPSFDAAAASRSFTHFIDSGSFASCYSKLFQVATPLTASVVFFWQSERSSSRHNQISKANTLQLGGMRLALFGSGLIDTSQSRSDYESQNFFSVGCLLALSGPMPTRPGPELQQPMVRSSGNAR